MALYWPKEKVALDIVDDPQRNPFEGDDDYTVLRVTCADLADYESFSRIYQHLASLLGCRAASTKDARDANRALHTMLVNWMSNTGEDLDEESMLGSFPFSEGGVPSGYPFDVPDGDDDSCEEGLFDDYVRDRNLDNVEILATSEEEGEAMRLAARSEGRHVRKVSVWEGPVPEGSFEMLSSGMRMSTPEYFFFRKANQLPFAEAVQLGCELCGKYRTSITQYDAGEDYDYLLHTRTSTSLLRSYLRGARGTKECKRARRVLRYVSDNASSPMATFLHLWFCLSRTHGGYGLARSEFSQVYETQDGLAPSSAGPYLAYDLVWPSKRVAVQYVGSHEPSDSEFSALEADFMRIVCVSDKDVKSPARLDRIARRVADLLGTTLPEDNEKWCNTRKRLWRQLEVPTYPHMRLTLPDIETHQMP